MKQFTSWGEFIEVETVNRKFDHVILCPDPNNINYHFLEASNGDVVKVNTSDIVSLKRDGQEKYMIV